MSARMQEAEGIDCQHLKSRLAQSFAFWAFFVDLDAPSAKCVPNRRTRGGERVNEIFLFRRALELLLTKVCIEAHSIVARPSESSGGRRDYFGLCERQRPLAGDCAVEGLAGEPRDGTVRTPPKSELERCA